MKQKHKRMFENIYDLIKGGDFEEEARKELRAFIKRKNISWDGDSCIIKIGERFAFRLIEK